MSKGFTVVVAVLVVVFGWLVFGKQDNKISTPSLTFATVQKDVTAGGKLYDVRTPEEFKLGHYENAVNWPLQDITAGKLPETAKDAKIYLYCESGSRSSQAAGLLKNAGYTNVTDLGGLSRVKSMGGTLTQ